jgi:hypothetical protein
MPSGYMPNKDAELLGWMRAFVTVVSESPKRFGVGAELLAELEEAVGVFAKLYSQANAGETRTRVVVLLKNEARVRAQEVVRAVVRVAQAQPGFDDAVRIALGLRVPKKPSKIHPPESRPSVFLPSVAGRSVRVELGVIGEDRAGKPTNVLGASIYTYVGEQCPADPREWQFAFNTTLTSVDVEFNRDVPAGSCVWVCAVWFNRKMQTGPMSNPISTYIAGGMARPTRGHALAA